METLRKDVQQKFDKIREAINLREKLLLRQIDAISSISNRQNNKNFVTTGTTNYKYNYNSNTAGHGHDRIDDIKFVTENEDTIFSYLRTFGKFSLDNINFANDLYANEDYILPNIDHEIMYKQMPMKDSCNNSLDEEKIIVDFSNNKKLINDNVNNINDSIINITLNEAKELIKRTEQVPLINYNVQNIFQTASIVSIDTTSSTLSSPLNDEEKYNSSEQLKLTTKPSLESNQSDGGKSKIKLSSSHRKSFKPKITINNCNGTINLKNISNLIINCANQDTLNIKQDNSDKSPSDSIAESQPIFSSITENGNENMQDEDEDEEFDDEYEEITTSNTNTTTTKDNEENCEFYNRLISEIKNTLKQHPQHKHTNNKSTTTDNIPLESSTNTSSQSNNNNNNNNNDNNSNTNRKFLLRNFENLKIVLETTQNDDNQTPTQHPIQIEQWLAEIISETEIEPVQNTEILETKNTTRNNNNLLQNE